MMVDLITMPAKSPLKSKLWLVLPDVMFFNLLHKVKLVSKDFGTELTFKPRCDN